MIRKTAKWHTVVWTAAVLALQLQSACAAASVTVNESSPAMTAEEVTKMVAEASDDFYHDTELKKELASEIAFKTEVVPAYEYGNEERDFYILTHEGKSMRFFMEIIGEPDADGKYPLFLTLHGGGGGPAEGNNDQWIDMFRYYKGTVENGIYIACRGITDTWDLHFQEDSYPLYDRLIEAMVLNYSADPDRVYLLGFSAGGDGVYQIAPRLADRFAAVNMSSGHPNGVSLLNVSNCPICLQTGIRDYYDEEAMRSVRCAEFEKILSGYHDQYGFGYEHRVLIHVPEGHNYDDCENSVSVVLQDPTQFAERAGSEDMLGVFLDVMEENGFVPDVSELSYLSAGMSESFDEGITKAVTDSLQLETTETDANAVRYVTQFTRSSAPEQIVWDLGTRAREREKESFYWLKADSSVNAGVITASADRASNSITVEPDENVNGDFEILFHPALVDVSKPVTIHTPDGTCTVEVHPTREEFEASIRETGDPELACVGGILYSELVCR